MPTIMASKTPAQTISLGRQLGCLLKGGDVILLSGDLGAGKTQFTKGVARGLRIETTITSPTFNLVLEYPVLAFSDFARLPSSHDDDVTKNDRGLLRHFDLYRLEESSQLDDIDYFRLLEDENAVSIVEWGDKFPDAMPEQYLEVIFTEKDDGLRELTFTAVGQRAEHLLQVLQELQELKVLQGPQGD